MSERPWGNARAAEWHSLNQGGWEYLLPDGRDARWLCVDALEGATTAFLSRLCREVHVAPRRPEGAAAIESWIALLGLGNVRVHPNGWLARDGACYDGFVLNDLRGDIGEAELAHWLDAARAVVRPDGFLYVAVRNRYGYARLRRGERSSGNLNRPGPILQRLGRADAIVHPFVCDESGRLLDVIADTGYVSAKNPSRAGERLRRLVLGPHMAPRFSPGFGIIARGPGTPPTQLAAIVRETVDRGFLAPGATFKRYHVLRGGKAIVSLGAPGRGFGQVIVVFARGEISIARRDREFAMLARLRALADPIVAKVPQPYFRSEAVGTPAYLMQEFPGITLDAPVPQLEAATREAAIFLERLHVATASVAGFDEPVFDRTCGGIFRDAEGRYPMLGAQLAGLRDRMLDSLRGARLPLVWMHGDFKVENIIVEPQTSKLLGVIDWEHTEPESLPLLDLWYLLLYNRQIRGGTHFFPAVEALMGPRGLGPAEDKLVSGYVRALRIPEATIPPLVGALIVHHCGRRVLYDSRDGAMMEWIGKTVDACSRFIEASGTGKVRDAR